MYVIRILLHPLFPHWTCLWYLGKTYTENHLLYADVSVLRFAKRYKSRSYAERLARYLTANCKNVYLAEVNEV